MSLSDLLPKVQSLTRADKLRLIQIMIVDLAQEEGLSLIEAGVTYPVWSPNHAFDAAEAMLSALKVR